MTEYTTYITFTGGGGHHTEETRTQDLGSTIQRLLRGPAAQANMIKEVKIVERATDSIVFLAENNKIKFPPQPKYARE
jgi:hypothetical protein